MVAITPDLSTVLALKKGAKEQKLKLRDDVVAWTKRVQENGRHRQVGGGVRRVRGAGPGVQLGRLQGPGPQGQDGARAGQRPAGSRSHQPVRARSQDLRRPRHDVLRAVDVQVRNGPEDGCRTVRPRFTVWATTRTDLVEQDARTDGMFPLLTNTDLTPAQVLDAYKAQPRLEKRFEQLKSVEAVAPVWLKKAPRIEALLFLYFLSVLVQALLERELRQAMVAAGIDHLPLYPEERECRAPSAERVLEVFASLQRHDLWAGGRRVQTFQPQLDPLQERIVTLLGMRTAEFTT
jgi:hypothetical protein